MAVNKQSGIKSAQRGVITMAAGMSSVSATITSVDISKSVIKCLGQSIGAAGIGYSARLLLNSENEVIASRTIISSYITKIAFEVTEYF